VRKVPPELNNQLGIAVAQRVYWIYKEMLRSSAWQRLYNAGGRPQRLLWASTGTKDPNAPDTLYVQALAAPFTVNTMPEATLKAFADHGRLSPSMPLEAGDGEEKIGEFERAGIVMDELASRLQEEGAKSFVKSWQDLLAVIDSKCRALKLAA